MVKTLILVSARFRAEKQHSTCSAENARTGYRLG